MKKLLMIILTLGLGFVSYTYAGNKEGSTCSTCSACAKKKKYSKNRFIKFSYGMTFSLDSFETSLSDFAVSFGGDISSCTSRNYGFFETGILSIGDGGGGLTVKYGYNLIQSRGFSLGLYLGPVLGARYYNPPSGSSASTKAATSNSDLVDGLNLAFGGDAGLALSSYLNRSLSIYASTGVRHISYVKQVQWGTKNMHGYVNLGLLWHL